MGKDIINEVNEMIAKEAAKPDINDDNHSGDSKPDTNQPTTQSDTATKISGKLILDATCTPADIHYPTDTWLLNEVREVLEKIIDQLRVENSR